MEKDKRLVEWVFVTQAVWGERVRGVLAKTGGRIRDWFLRPRVDIPGRACNAFVASCMVGAGVCVLLVCPTMLVGQVRDHGMVCARDTLRDCEQRSF